MKLMLFCLLNLACINFAESKNHMLQNKLSVTKKKLKIDILSLFI